MNWRARSSERPLSSSHDCAISTGDFVSGGEVMTLTASLFSLTVGALLLAVVTRVAVPPATWLAFALLLHACRSMPAASGLVSLFVASYVALAVGNRGVFPFSGPAYFAVI